jgi:hypothetical protein
MECRIDRVARRIRTAEGWSRAKGRAQHMGNPSKLSTA